MAGDSPKAPRLRIVTGKGGVGKSTVAAALALAELRRGKRVLLAEIDAGDRLAKLLGVPPSGFAMKEVLPGLWHVDMNAEEAIHEYALMLLRFERVYKTVFKNRLVRSFIRLIPSLGELVMLGKVWFHETERQGGRPRFDVIVLDAPATGHAMALLRTPRAVAGTVPDGPLKVNADNIGKLLADQGRTVLHVVTTPEEMPVNEALELHAAARGSLQLALGATIVNQDVPPLPAPLAGLADDRGLARVAAALTQREAKRLAGEEHLQRLAAERLVRLPRLVGGASGRDELETLSQRLEAAL